MFKWKISQNKENTKGLIINKDIIATNCTKTGLRNLFSLRKIKFITKLSNQVSFVNVDSCQYGHSKCNQKSI